MFSRGGRYLERLTDYRSLFGQVFTDYFGDDPGMLETFMPGYTAARQSALDRGITDFDALPLCM